MMLVLGVDAGNTKTVALLARSDGTIIGKGRGGCGDMYNATSVTAALAAVDRAVSAALLEAEAPASSIDAALFSMAGADWPEDFVFLRDQMVQRAYGQAVHVVNDVMGALRAGSPDGTGVVVACGTGAAVGARDADGTTWHASFWLENLGSGALGSLALREIYRAQLGISARTMLTDRVLAFYDLASVQDLLHHFTSRLEPHPANAAQLARVVLDTACAGDQTAQTLVRAHGEALGDYALAAARQVGPVDRPFHLVLAGGLFRHSFRLLPETLLARVHAAAPCVCPIYSRFEPVVGALLLALEGAGVVVDDDILARIRAGMPPVSFFAT